MYRGVCDTWSSTIRLAACRHVARYASDITRVSVRCVNQTRGTYDHGQRADARTIHAGCASSHQHAGHRCTSRPDQRTGRAQPEPVRSQRLHQAEAGIDAFPHRQDGRRPDAHHAYDRGGHHPGRQHHPRHGRRPRRHSRMRGHLLRHRPVRDHHRGDGGSQRQGIRSAERHQ